jgi:hypothetical protein
LAGAVCLLVAINLIFYLRNRQPKTPPQNFNANQSAVSQPKPAPNKYKTEEEIKNDKIIQSLLQEKEQENWKTYQNKIYGFEIKYPQEWPDPSLSGPQDGSRFRYKVSFREDGDPNSNGLDIYIYRNTQSGNKILKADYSDNLVQKDSAAPNYSNCNTLEVFSIGKEEYPAVQVYNLPDDPCFAESYFFSLKKGFYIFDIVPQLKSGINYSGYDGEKKVNQEFPLFYQVMSTLDFPLVKKSVISPGTSTIRNVVKKPKVEAPRVSGGIRCPEKIQHPHKSKTKGHHMDEDCCLDPDESRNPKCAY